MTRPETLRLRRNGVDRSVTVERRPLALRDAPGHLRRRMLAVEAEAEPVRCPVEPASAPVATARPDAGRLAADVLRHIDHVRGRFGAALVGGWL